MGWPPNSDKQFTNNFVPPKNLGHLSWSVTVLGAYESSSNNFFAENTLFISHAVHPFGIYDFKKKYQSTVTLDKTRDSLNILYSPFYIIDFFILSFTFFFYSFIFNILA